MSRQNRRLRSSRKERSAEPDRAALHAFYASSQELVEQQFSSTFEADLQAAYGLVTSVEGDHWAW